MGDLIWALTRKDSAFLVKRNGKQFSTEAGNLANINSFKYSGLSNKRTPDINAAEKGGDSLTVKAGKNFRKPAKSTKATVLKRDFRRVAKTVKASTANYRDDLTATALARLSKVTRANKAAAAGVSYKVRNNKRSHK